MKKTRALLATILAATMPLMASCGGPNSNFPSLKEIIDSAKSTVTHAGEGNLDMLEALPSVDKSQAPAYERSYFGTAWTDNNTMQYGGNGCSTRNDILARDLSDVQKDGDCKVTSGILRNDPYTGKDIVFIYGRNTSSAIQIDHVVSLKDAWDSGAYLLSDDDRVNYANDPEVLIASDGPQNMAKGAKDASQWLVPMNQDYRCEYASKQIYIKSKYRLGVSTDERIALRKQMEQC